jgi:hypothetical protein
MAIALAGGSLIFLGFMIVMFFGVVIGFYTVRGSGIHETPYERSGSAAPGAKGPGSTSDRYERERLHNWSRGTGS